MVNDDSRRETAIVRSVPVNGSPAFEPNFLTASWLFELKARMQINSKDVLAVLKLLIG